MRWLRDRFFGLSLHNFGFGTEDGKEIQRTARNSTVEKVIWMLSLYEALPGSGTSAHNSSE